jgi:hypothetical protein
VLVVRVYLYLDGPDWLEGGSVVLHLYRVVVSACLRVSESEIVGAKVLAPHPMVVLHQVFVHQLHFHCLATSSPIH